MKRPTRVLSQLGRFDAGRNVPASDRSGGAGGTRTHKSDASHLRRCRNNGHSHPFPSGCIPLDPARMGIG